VAMTQAMTDAVRAIRVADVRAGISIALGGIAAARATWTSLRSARTILSSRGVALIGFARRTASSSRAALVPAVAAAAQSCRHLMTFSRNAASSGLTATAKLARRA